MSQSAKQSTIKDMTTGSPAKLILGFAIPMLMGLLFQQFYSMVDTIIVGKFLGVDALASVGSTAAINFMINGFVIGVCTGFSIPVAQRFGAQDYKDMRRFVANAGWLASFFAVVMTVIVCLLTRQILVWMQTPDNIIDGAYSYIFFVFAGIPATYLYNTLAGIIRALGDSRTPVYFLILSSLINIVLDLFFIVDRSRNSRCCLCYGDCTGCFRHSLPDLYEEEIRYFKNASGGNTNQYLPPLSSLHDGYSHGTSVLHHRHRFGGDPDRHQLSRFHCGCLGYCRSEDRYVLLLPL